MIKSAGNTGNENRRHKNGRKHESYFPHHLESQLREVKHLGAREIYDAIKADIYRFADPCDDISIVVIKRT